MLASGEEKACLGTESAGHKLMYCLILFGKEHKMKKTCCIYQGITSVNETRYVLVREALQEIQQNSSLSWISRRESFSLSVRLDSENHWARVPFTME